VVRLQQLRYVVAVADERHFTHAAARLHVSQPALSTQVRALEEELGAALFDRTRGDVALTAAGEAFLPWARQALAASWPGGAAADWHSARPRA
jgi:DNA-binding transcriptional LysR family regulator